MEVALGEIIYFDFDLLLEFKLRELRLYSYSPDKERAPPATLINSEKG